MKVCPFCKEEVQDEAIKCRWCAERFDNADDPDREKTLLEAHPGWFYYYKLFAAAVALTALAFSYFYGTVQLVLLGVAILLCLYVALDRGGRWYRITNHRVTVKKGILNKQTDEVSIIDLKNVSIKQSLMGRIANYGDVVGGTAGTSGNEMMIEGVNNPSKFKDTIAKQKSLLT